MALIGYARVSTADQNPALQTDALVRAGCERIWKDAAGGGGADRRPELEAALSYVRKGDTLVVWRLDRLGRSLADLISRLDHLEQRGIGFQSLTESIDTTTATGRLIFHMLASVAEFERSLLRERTYAGLAAAAARGRKGGRKPKVTTRKLAVIRQMHDDREPVAEIAKTVGLSKTTVFRWLRRDYS